MGNPPRLQHALEELVSQQRPMHQSADFLRRLYLLFRGSDHYLSHFFAEIDLPHLQGWLQNPPPENTLFEALHSADLLPFPTILSLYDRQGKKARLDVELTREDIQRGNFDVTNPLHVELEYCRYLFGGKPKNEKASTPKVPEGLSLEKFKQLPFLNVGDVHLDQYNLNMAKSTAGEAVKVFHFIKAIVEERKDVLVIGNLRYGNYFVIEPLEERIKKLGAHVFYEFVPSSPSRFSTSPGLQATLNSIQDRYSTVIVVDGTAEPDRIHPNYKEKGYYSRFPAAMNIYHDLFWPAGCGVGFWAPDLTIPFFVGNKLYETPQITNAPKQLYLLSATGRSADASRGHFDNPEKFTERYVFGFTARGFGFAPVASCEVAIVKAVQKVMEQEIAVALD